MPNDKVSQLKAGTLRWRQKGVEHSARLWRGFSVALGKGDLPTRSRTLLAAIGKPRPRALLSAISKAPWREAWRPASLALDYILLAAAGIALIGLYGFGAYGAFVLAHETFSGDWQTIHDIEAAKIFFPTLAAIIAAPFFVWRVFIAHRQAQALRKTADAASARYSTDVFSRAVEQLGARRDVSEIVESGDGLGAKKETLARTRANLELRLAAIYSLERLARDSAQDYWAVMDVLCAYIRNPQNHEAAKNFAAATDKITDYLKAMDDLPPLRADVQAAIDVIGRRKPRGVTGARHALNLRDTNLQRANFSAGHFSFALFTNARLESAAFTQAHLEGASFLGAKLDDVSFEGAHLQSACFFETDLRRVRNLTAEQIASAIGDATVRLPYKVDWPAHWPMKNLTSEERQNWVQETGKAITAGSKAVAA